MTDRAYPQRVDAYAMTQTGTWGSTAQEASDTPSATGLACTITFAADHASDDLQAQGTLVQATVRFPRKPPIAQGWTLKGTGDDAGVELQVVGVRPEGGRHARRWAADCRWLH